VFETDRQKRAAYYFEAQEILARDVPYLWLYEPQSGAAYNANLQGMYAWSAKSNVYFAQDAWWIDGNRSNRNSSGTFGQRRLYFLLAAVALISIIFVAIFLRRKMRRS
jgi:hypothetical protein